MARTVNPYVADAGQYNVLGQGLNNLANVFLGRQQGAGELAQMEALAWGARKDREDVIDTRAARTGRQQLGDWVASYDPSGDPRQAFGGAVAGGSMDPAKLADLQRLMVANFGGSDAQLGRAFAGAGDALGVNDAVSLDHQSRIRADNHSNDVALDRASLTLNERLGDAFASGGMDTLEDIYRRQSPNLYASADKTRGEMAGTNAPNSRDGLLARIFMERGPDAASQAQVALYGADAQSRPSRDAVLAQIYTEQGPEAAEAARTALYGAESSDGSTLSPGQVRIDNQGNVVYAAPAGPERPVTMSPGQAMYDPMGNLLASGPEKPQDSHILSPGQVLYNDDGSVRATGPEKAQPGFTLDAGDTRYDGQGNPIASQPAAPPSGKDAALEAKRRADLGQVVYDTIGAYLTEQGVPKEQFNLLPGDVQARVIETSVDAAMAGRDPRAVALQQMDQLGMAYTDDNSAWPFVGEPELTLGNAPAQRGTAPPPNPAQDGTAGNTDFARARDAIARGADRGQVRDRLLQAGYTDIELIEAGF